MFTLNYERQELTRKCLFYGITNSNLKQARIRKRETTMQNIYLSSAFVCDNTRIDFVAYSRIHFINDFFLYLS